MTMIKEHTLTIKPFDGSDASYEAIVRIDNETFPQYPTTVSDTKKDDAERLPKYHFARFVGRNADGQIIGEAVATHDDGSFHAQKFWAEVWLLPEWQGVGFGRKLYNHLLDHLQPFNPTVLEAATTSDQARAIRFLEERGYELKTVEYSSVLDLNSFNPDAFASYSQRTREHGIEIIDYNEFKFRFPKDWGQRLYKSVIEINRDVPWHDEITEQPYAEWIDRHLKHDDRIDDAYLLAMDDADIIGVTMIFRSKATDDTLFTGLTGIKRSQRRKGIAIALKCQALSWAKQNMRNGAGIAPKVATENEKNNPMYVINERLGFVRQPDVLIYRKEI